MKNFEHGTGSTQPLESGPRLTKLEALSLLLGKPYALSGKAPESIRAFANKHELKVVKNRNGWYLCSDSEPFLERSLEIGAAVVINDFLVVKFIGKPSALCLRDVKMGKHTFKKGHWYSPNTPEQRQQLYADFEAGKARTYVESGDWVEMRPMHGGGLLKGITWEETSMADKLLGMRKANALLERAQRYANKKEDTLPEMLDGRTRRQFWQAHKDVL